MNIYTKGTDTKGFTILELLIATAISSGAILMLMFGFISMSQSYTKGLTITETQNTARGILNTLSQSIQFGDPSTIYNHTTTPSTTVSTGWFCADGDIFSYTLGQLVTTSSDGLVEQAGACITSGSFSASVLPYPTQPSKELLNPNMRLTTFSVSSGPSSTYQINVKIVYGGDSFLQGYTPYNGGDLYYDIGSNQIFCSGQSGQDFCAVSDLQTVVESRIAN